MLGLGTIRRLGSYVTGTRKLDRSRSEKLLLERFMFEPSPLENGIETGVSASRIQEPALQPVRVFESTSIDLLAEQSNALVDFAVDAIDFGQVESPLAVNEVGLSHLRAASTPRSQSPSSADSKLIAQSLMMPSGPCFPNSEVTPFLIPQLQGRIRRSSPYNRPLVRPCIV